MSATGPMRVADRRRLQTRSEILESAWQLCRDGGLTSLSLRVLAERVGMRAPSLYSYFASKDAIYDAMFADGQRELLAVISDLPVDDADRESVREAAHRYFCFCTSDPVRYQLLFQRTIPGFEPSPESYALASEVLDTAERAITAAGLADARLVDLWTALLTGLADQQISNDPGGDRWYRLLDEAVDLFCDHAGIPPSR